MAEIYDDIVIGAGSVGVPTALFLSMHGRKVLVLDKHPSPGQGQNKAAIGGVRSTHSHPAKILLCQESIRILSEWEERYGDTIGWKQGGYCFPVYRKEEETTLRKVLPEQKKYGCNIDWISKDDVASIVPGIVRQALRGGIYSPEDGQASPLLTINAMYQLSKRYGCTYRFCEEVLELLIGGERVQGVRITKGSYTSSTVVNAAGAYAAKVGGESGYTPPVEPDSHEAAISNSFKQFLMPMVVDMRPGREKKTANFYFTQTLEGPLIFCYTPLQLKKGTDREPTSEFLPVLASRVIGLVPRLRNILIRRTWRGLYPMTPDGLPICGEVPGARGYFAAVGMCGQGFMLGPGVGRTMANLIVEGKPLIDPVICKTLRPDRDFGTTGGEALV